MNQLTKVQRLEAANEFIQAIAGCGRHFLTHDGFTSRLELSKHGRVYFIDYYSKKRIYTHTENRWKGFTSGGTLRSIIECLRNFVMKGTQMRAGYFHADAADNFKHIWGYGQDILSVKAAAIRLGIAK